MAATLKGYLQEVLDLFNVIKEFFMELAALLKGDEAVEGE